MKIKQYIEECVGGQLLTPNASLLILDFFEKFQERYPELSLVMDGCPGGDSDSFLLALDDGTHHIEFELIDGYWEFFYIERNSEEYENISFHYFDSLDRVDYFIKQVDVKKFPQKTNVLNV